MCEAVSEDQKIKRGDRPVERYGVSKRWGPQRFRVRVREEARLRDGEAANKRIKEGKAERERENETEKETELSSTLSHQTRVMLRP